MKQRWYKFCLGSLLLLAVFLMSCGGGTAASGSSNTASASSNASGSGNAASGQALQQGAQKKAAGVGGPQYLVKTLKVTMEVKDTRQAADDLQAWITTTDPRATSAGMSYEQVSENVYNISMSFSVQADLYPNIQHYLRDYAPQKKGQLLEFQESVQDITNDYIDTQSRLKNLRGEQARLLDLLNHTQALNDIIIVEQRLTDVEGQIEQIEEHANDLSSQLRFYTITIVLQPSGSVVAPPSTAGWSAGQIFYDAFAAALALAQALLTVLIWLLAFSIYIIPLAVISWFVLRWRKQVRIAPSSTPKA